MYNINSNEARLDDLLNRIAESLQLDKTRREKMVTAYKAVSEWIEADEGFFKDVEFEIYPHGSVLIGTTVKPTNKEEFDLDFVIHIRMDWDKYNPEEVYRELWRRLDEHETYKQMLMPKNRVIRLNYAGDFHIDIMPGCQEDIFDSDRILVRDKKLKDSVSSNPRGFGKWFNAKADTVQEFLLEKAYAMQELPEEEPYHLKKPLKRGVQLIKRYRDIYFEKDYDNATSSIILTTLAGEFYNGEGTIYETVNNVVAKMHQAAKVGIYAFNVSNPVNNDEDFTEKWKQEPILFDRFHEFVIDFKRTWENLKREADITDSEQQLKNLFGDLTFSKALSEQQNYFNKAFGSSVGSTLINTQKDKYEGLRNLAMKSKPYCKRWDI